MPISYVIGGGHVGVQLQQSNEKKIPIVNQQCVVYKFQCDLCDASYVVYTLRHLHQHAVEHNNLSSSIGKHFINEHCIVPKDLDKQFFCP